MRKGKEEGEEEREGGKEGGAGGRQKRKNRTLAGSNWAVSQRQQQQPQKEFPSLVRSCCLQSHSESEFLVGISRADKVGLPPRNCLMVSNHFLSRPINS